MKVKSQWQRLLSLNITGSADLISWDFPSSTPYFSFIHCKAMTAEAKLPKPPPAKIFSDRSERLRVIICGFLQTSIDVLYCWRLSGAAQVEVVLTGFECAIQPVCQNHLLPYRLLLFAHTKSSCLPRHWRWKKESVCNNDCQKNLNIFLWKWSMCWLFVCKWDLLQSFTGIPSIFALMSVLRFLMAERTASKRKPGHLSSLRISLQRQHNTNKLATTPLRATCQLLFHFI